MILSSSDITSNMLPTFYHMFDCIVSKSMFLFGVQYITRLSKDNDPVN